jgi:hypothetical protein
MGAKKKARSRQKQAIRDACSLSDSSSNSHTSDGETCPRFPHFLLPGDNLHKFLTHIHTCKKADSRRLSKFMPSLNHDLSMGNHAAEDLVGDFMMEYDSKFKNMGDLERIAIMGKLRMATKMEE